MTRVGIVCEGTFGNEDEKVLSHLAGRIVPAASIECAPQGRKPDLIQHCGAAVKAFLDDGCDRVLVVWDLEPGFGRPICLRSDRQAIFASLAAAGVPADACVFLIAIHKELESWLIASGPALSAVFSTPAHRVRLNDRNNPEHVGNPKGALRRLFKTHGRSDYVAGKDAFRIAENVPHGFGGLKNCPSFERFGRKLTMKCPAA